MGRGFEPHPEHGQSCKSMACRIFLWPLFSDGGPIGAGKKRIFFENHSIERFFFYF